MAVQALSLDEIPRHEDRVREWASMHGLPEWMSDRKKRMYYLEALYDGSWYEHLPAWEPGHVTVGTDKVELRACQRQPKVMRGGIAQVVDRLVESLIGEGRNATLTFRRAGATEAPASDEEAKASDALNAKYQAALFEQLELDESGEQPVVDGLVKGALALAVTQLEDKTLEAVYLDPKHCEVVLVAHAGGMRAEQIAAELEAAEGAPFEVKRATAGAHLYVPQKTPRSDDVVFVREEYTSTLEVEQVDQDGDGTGTWHERTFLYRTDWTPSGRIEWEAVDVTDIGSGQRPDMKVEAFTAHDLDLVPVAWVRAPRPDPHETEGRSTITRQVETLAMAVDRISSLQDDSVMVAAWPTLALIDLERVKSSIQRAIGIDDGLGLDANPKSAERFRSKNRDQQGKIESLEPSGAGLEAASNHITSLTREIQKLTGVVEWDQAAAVGVLSGVALRRLMQPLIARVNRWRLRLVKFYRRLVRIAAAFHGEDVDAQVVWPKVIPFDADEIQAIAQAYITATGGSAIVSRETAVKAYAAAIELDDADAEVERVEKEAKEAAEHALSLIDAKQPAPDDPNDPPPSDE